MKTFTVTYHHTFNYGAVLQAYALQHAIESLGHENVIMEYRTPPGTKKPKKTLTNAIKKSVVSYIEKKNKEALIRREQVFYNFHKNKLKLSRKYKDSDDLKNDPPEAEVLITGSDQVWNMRGRHDFIPARFLDFGAEGVRKISYAASMEGLSYSEEQKQKVREYLKDFYAISLREENAREYISEIIGKEVERVLDPVLLLDKSEWMKIATDARITEPYILCYQVQSNPAMKKIVKHLKKKTGLKVVVINPSNKIWIRADYTLFDVSPEEFLGLYNSATYVVSASFHGTAFGLLFNKPTFAAKKSNGTGRISELMKLFQHEKFCIGVEDDIPDVDEFDPEKISEILNKERTRSLKYLESNLAQ